MWNKKNVIFNLPNNILDGCGNNSDYAGTGDGSQKTLFASVAQFVGLRAELFDESGDKIGTIDIWINPMVNSWMSVIPIRYCLEPETIGKFNLDR